MTHLSNIIGELHKTKPWIRAFATDWTVCDETAQAESKEIGENYNQQLHFNKESCDSPSQNSKKRRIYGLSGVLRILRNVEPLPREF